MMISRIILMAVFTACFSSMKAQERDTASSQAVSFYYDAAGNRTSRSLVLNMTAQPAPGQEESEDGRREEIKTEDMMGLSLSISADSRDGTVKIQVFSVSWIGQGTFLVFTTGGMKVLDGPLRRGENIIDISSQPSGIYAIKIDMGEYHETWKIVKK